MTNNKRQKKLPIILDAEEQKALIKQPNKRYITGERNKLMISFMLAAGTRLSETINLKWKHINLNTGKINIIDGKGGKDRIVYISNFIIDSLRTWRERQSKEIGEVQNIFTTTKGDPLDARYIQRMIKRYSAKAQIEKNVSPHTLRHTFATDLYKNSKNIVLVQKALGHSDISTTMIYTHIVDDELEYAMKNFRK